MDEKPSDKVHKTTHSRREDRVPELLRSGNQSLCPAHLWRALDTLDAARSAIIAWMRSEGIVKERSLEKVS